MVIPWKRITAAKAIKGPLINGSMSAAATVLYLHGFLSSLGGFYATYLAEEYGFPAALINPAVRPFELWQQHLGQHRNYYTDEIHTVTKKHIEELKELDKSQLQYPRNIMVLLQSGDEVLDYTQARDKYKFSKCIVRDNGSHSYENFADELPAIFDFLLSRID